MHHALLSPRKVYTRQFLAHNSRAAAAARVAQAHALLSARLTLLRLPCFCPVAGFAVVTALDN